MIKQTFNPRETYHGHSCKAWQRIWVLAIALIGFSLGCFANPDLTDKYSTVQKSRAAVNNELLLTGTFTSEPWTGKAKGWVRGMVMQDQEVSLESVNAEFSRSGNTLTITNFNNFKSDIKGTIDWNKQEIVFEAQEVELPDMDLPYGLVVKKGVFCKYNDSMGDPSKADKTGSVTAKFTDDNEFTIDGWGVIANGTTMGMSITIAITGEQAVLKGPNPNQTEKSATLTVNEAAGVNVIAETVDGSKNVEFLYGEAKVEGAEYVRIYNVVPYIIASVKVNGKEITAEKEGEYYFIEMTSAVKTIEITVKEIEVVESSMMVTVEGLYNFKSLAILGKNGEASGMALAMEMDFRDGEPVQIYYTNFDLPLQVSGTWESGKGYKMEVTLDGKVLTPVSTSQTSSLYMNIEPTKGSNMVISLIEEQPVVLTVNEAAGVRVLADTADDQVEVNFVNGRSESRGALCYRIYNVDPYIIKSVKVNGKSITAQEEESYYFIEATPEIKTIDITVEENRKTQEILDAITKAANADRNAVKAVQNQWESVVTQTAKDYAAYVVAFSKDKETIDSKLAKVSSDIDAAQKKAEDALSTYESPSVSAALSEINTLITKYQNDVKAAAESAQSDAKQKSDADHQVLKSLKDDLEQAAKDYSTYVDKSKYDALVKSIDDFDKKVTEAYNTALSSGQYTTPWTNTEIAALQKSVADFIQGLKDAKENQDNQQILDAITKAANSDRNALKALQSQWESVVAQTAKDYAAYVGAFSKDKETIDSKLAKVSSDIDAAQKKATDNLSTYESPSVSAALSEINTLITKYQSEVKASYDKAQQEAEAAANADRQVLQNMKNQLEQASKDYSAYVNKNKYNALVKFIDDWNKEVTEAYNTALSSGNKYATPWSTAEINALQKQIDEFVQGLKDAKEADTNKQIVEEITKAANADREAVQKLLTEWEQVLADIAKDYNGYTIAFDKANIDTKFSKVSADIDAAQKKAVDELSTYSSPSVDASLTEIRGLIDKYKQDVEKAVNKIKTDAATAAENDRKAVKSAREASQSVIDATDRKYPAFVITADKNSIYSRYDKLSSDIDNAYDKAIETLSTYVSPSVSETLAEIDAMVSQYQRDVAAAAEKAREDASKVASADKATLSSLSAQIEQINSKYAPLGCINPQKMNAIKTTIQTLSGKVDTELSEIFTTGKYQTPWTSDELQKIKDDISALEEDCNSRLNSSIDTASKADLDKVDNLKKEYDKMKASLHSQYAGFCDEAREKAIEGMFTTITNNINEAASKAKAETKLYVSPDVDNYLQKTINAQMEEYRTEVLEKAYETMSGADKAATKDRETLKGFKSSLEKAATDYAKYVDQSEYDALCATIEDWNKKVDQAYDNVAQTGDYSSPWSQNEISALQREVEDFITGLRNAKDFEENTTLAINEAAEADRQALRNAQEAWETAISDTNSKYPAFASETANKAIEDKFTSLSSDIEQAKTTALESMRDYESPSVDSTLDEIEAMITQYQRDVEAAANKALEEANQYAERDRNELAHLTEQLDELNSAYSPIECMDTNTLGSITSSIEGLNGQIERELNSIFTKGAYKTPWTAEEFQYIQQSIKNLEGVCNRKLQNLVDEASNVDLDKVNTLRDDFLDVLENPHKFYANFCDPTREREINDKLDEISDNITLAASDAMSSIQLYESPDVDGSIEGIQNEINAYKQDIIGRLVATDAETLQGMESMLQEIYDSYEDILNMEVYESLRNTLDELFYRLQETGEEAAFSTGVYETPWDEDETYTLNQAIINLDYECFDNNWVAVEEASNEDLIKVNTVKARFDDLCAYLNAEYKASCDPATEKKINSKLEDLLTRINEEASDAQNNKHTYKSPDVDATLEQIQSEIAAYERYVMGSDLTEEEIEALASLDSESLDELKDRLEHIYTIYLDYLDMTQYLSICADLNLLYYELQEAVNEAKDTHKYSTPWAEGDLNDLRKRIDELEKNAQEAGITSVEADPQEAIYYDLNGFRVQNPVAGKLYIRVLGGKARKVIL